MCGRTDGIECLTGRHVCCDDQEVRGLERITASHGIEGILEVVAPGADGAYAFSMTLAPGLVVYRVELGTRTGGRDTVLERVGDLVCGDAFLIDGQSNALATDTAETSPAETSPWIRSYGQPPADPRDDGVNRWCRPVWKAREGEKAELGWWGMELAKRLVEHRRIPVCIVNGAVGGTRIDQHQRNDADPADRTTIYGRTLWRARRARIEHGIRAIVWHQGESDANQADRSRTLAGPLYEDFLARLITASRREIGREVPWFVARASYHVPGDESSTEIRAAQNAVCRDGLALVGPDTDLLGAPFRDGGGKGVHFSGPGLVRHAESWFEKIAPWLEGRVLRDADDQRDVAEEFDDRRHHLAEDEVRIGDHPDGAVCPFGSHVRRTNTRDSLDPQAVFKNQIPDIKLDVMAQKGNAVFFSYDRPDPATLTLHGGAPVLEGEKWVATKWLRQGEFV